jgi:hypothetical protein
MAAFGDLTKEQQLGYTNAKLQHHMELRRLIQRYRGASTDEERIAVQSAIDAKLLVEPTVDSYLAG